MKALNKGDAVLLTLDHSTDPVNSGSLCITQAMRKYRDRQFKVSKVCRFGYEVYYELEGLVTEAGVPYAVAPDHGTPIRALRSK